MTEEWTIRLRVSLVAILKVAALLAGLATCVLVFTVSFRLWAQSTAQESLSFPGDLIYAFGQLIVAPFSGFEKTRPIRETAILDYAALLALEAYLVTGSALTSLIWLTSRFWPARLRCFVIELDVAPALRELGTVDAWLAAKSRTSVSTGAAWLRDHDWSRLRTNPSVPLSAYVNAASARIEAAFASSRMRLSRLKTSATLATYARATRLAARAAGAHVMASWRTNTNHLSSRSARSGRRLISIAGATSTSLSRRWRLLTAAGHSAAGNSVSRREFLRRVLIHG